MFIIPLILLIFGLVSILIYTIVGPSNYERLKVGLKIGRLSDLPKSAYEVKVSGTENFFSATVYIKFKAPMNDIDYFIRSSKGMQSANPDPFNYENWKREYSYILEKHPWFNPLTSNGRIYEIPQDENADYGTVIVDDNTDTVYIKVSHS